METVTVSTAPQHRLIPSAPRRNPHDVVYAFIDTANLYETALKQGWRIDWRKFRSFLSARFGVEKAFQFIGYSEEKEPICKMLKATGYEIEYRPVTRYADGSQKANIDAWLIVKCMEEMWHCHKAVLVTGDGDFLPLCNHLARRNRLLQILVPSADSMSWMLKDYNSLLYFVDEHRDRFEYSPASLRAQS